MNSRALNFTSEIFKMLAFFRQVRLTTLSQFFCEHKVIWTPQVSLDVRFIILTLALHVEMTILEDLMRAWAQILTPREYGAKIFLVPHQGAQQERLRGCHWYNQQKNLRHSVSITHFEFKSNNTFVTVFS